MADGAVVVAGALHLDVVVTAPHLPARDETVMGETVRFVCGGKGGNQAVAASRHGARTVMLGRVGDDMFAPILLENLLEAGVDTAQIQKGEDAKSGMSVAIVDDDGEYGAIVVSGTNRQLDTRRFEFPDDGRLLVLQNEVPEPVNVDIAAKARAKGATVVLNAAPMRPIPDELMRCVDILIVNRFEASGLFGATVETTDDAVEVARGADDFNGVLIVTLGRDGLVFRRREGGVHRLDAHPVQPVSAHGAGDAFVGALAARLAGDAALMDALTYAQAAAALFVATPVAERAVLGPVQVRRFLGA